MILRRRERRRARIEVVPMIDVVFFLLVFFMIASLSMAQSRGLPVSLPRAATGSDAPTRSTAVTVARDGRTYVDRQAVAAERLGERLRAMAADDSRLAVVINADEEVPHGRVVEVLDQARAAGVGRIAVAIRSPRAAGAAAGSR